MKATYNGCVLGLGILLSSCSDSSEVRVYEIPKEERGTATPATPPQATPPVPQANPVGTPTMQVLPGMAEAASSFPMPEFAIPAGWREVPSEPPRRATFEAGNAVVAVSVFPGTVGGDEANAVRWARQVGLSADPQLLQPESTLALENGASVPVYQFDGVTPSGAASLRGAIVSRPGHTWFVKMTGSPEAVSAQRDAFNAFTTSFRFASVPPESAP